MRVADDRWEGERSEALTSKISRGKLDNMYEVRDEKGGGDRRDGEAGVVGLGMGWKCKLWAGGVEGADWVVLASWRVGEQTECVEFTTKRTSGTKADRPSLMG